MIVSNLTVGGDWDEAWMSRKPKRALIVSDDEVLRNKTARFLKSWCRDVTVVSGVAEAVAELGAPRDLLLMSVSLPDGNAVDLAAQVFVRRPVPVMIAIGEAAAAQEAFCLAQTGVRGFVVEPFSKATLDEVIRSALEEPISLECFIVPCVGTRPMREVKEEVGRLMVEQALAMCDGSRRGAARFSLPGTQFGPFPR